VYLTNGPGASGSYDYSGFDCNNPWAQVNETVYSTDPRPSIMRTLTQHNPEVCLFPDDLEALNVLYPDCAASRITKPVCYRADRFIGLFRLLAWTFVPVVCTMLFTIGLDVLIDTCGESRRSGWLHSFVRTATGQQEDPNAAELVQPHGRYERKYRDKTDVMIRKEIRGMVRRRSLPTHARIVRHLTRHLTRHLLPATSYPPPLTHHLLRATSYAPNL
jgi:hypothetical protein